MEYVEAIVAWTGGRSARARDWLVARGFDVIDMRAGLLITGDADAFERAFGVDPSHAPSRSLPVPADLAADVASITVRPAAQIH